MPVVEYIYLLDAMFTSEQLCECTESTYLRASMRKKNDVALTALAVNSLIGNNLVNLMIMLIY